MSRSRRVFLRPCLIRQHRTSYNPPFVPLLCQNHLSQVHGFFLELLSPAGRAHVSAVIRQRRALYGPGTLPLKDPITRYPGFTGAQKDLFGRVMLIVFRGILASVPAMVRGRKDIASSSQRQPYRK